MTERQMFEASFGRPANYFSLSARDQYEIDKRLGILDWQGINLTSQDMERFKAHYDK